MNFSVCHKAPENQPAISHNPMFMVLALLIFLLTGFGFCAQRVHAQSNPIAATITAAPKKNISIPASGEPIILQPGNNARLISPIKLQLVTRPGDDGLVRIELIGHDNRMIFAKLIDNSEYKGRTLLIDQEIPFEIRADETARLQIVLENTKGKTVFLTSVQLTLLLVKGTETSGNLPATPRIKIDQPVSGSTLEGNSLIIKGGIKPVNNSPVFIEVLSSDWYTLTSRIVNISNPTDQTAFVPLNVSLPFKAAARTPATIRIRQESNTLIKGTVLLWSEQVTFIP